MVAQDLALDLGQRRGAFTFHGPPLRYRDSVSLKANFNTLAAMPTWRARK